jgi:trk system potassium uptake protein TrkH
MVVPLLACLVYKETDIKAFLISIAITTGVGLLLKSCIHPRSHNMSRRDGCLLTAVVWVIFSAFGMLPFMLGGCHLNASESFFEAMSGFTTTGATVIRDVESCSHGILIWRALTQWIGGMGIVMFTLALIPSLNNNGGLSMFHAELNGITHDKLGARVSKTAKILWGVYAILTIILIILLWIGPMGFFDSVCQALTCISTGGYSTRNNSIGGFNSPYIKIVLTVFMFIGGVNFTLIFAAAKGRIKAFWENDVFRAYVGFIGIFYVLIAGSLVISDGFTGFENLLIDPLFHIVSAITSTGFSVGNFEAWGALTLTLTITMMFMGACAGSTTGGAKIDRILYLFKSFRVEMKRAIRPRAVHAIRINDVYITPEKSNEIVAFMLIFMLLIIGGGVMLASMGFPIFDAFFASFSCVCNNGLGAGVTGITGSFDFLPATGKWVMSALMLAGRLEVFTVIVLFAPSFWKK